MDHVFGYKCVSSMQLHINSGSVDMLCFELVSCVLQKKKNNPVHNTCVPFIIVSTVYFLQLGPSRLLEDTFVDVLALQEMRLHNDTLLLPETF